MSNRCATKSTGFYSKDKEYHMTTPALREKQDLLSTPPLPGDLPPVELTENARQVLVRRYVRRGKDGRTC